MRRTQRMLLAFAVLFSAATTAAAGPLYLTGKLGDSSLDAQFGRTFRQVVDGRDDGWGLGLGLKLGRYLAIQGEVHDFGQVEGFGSPCNDSADVCIEILVPVVADSTAVSLSVLPQIPLTRRLSLYGKVGVISWDTDLDEIGPAIRRRIDSFNEEELILGAGARLELPGPFGLFAELERVSDSFETVSFGATWGY